MTEGYTTQDSWLRPVGRADLIDLVADEFERPAASWSSVAPVARLAADCPEPLQARAA